MTLNAAITSRHGLLTDNSQVATLLSFTPGAARPMDMIKVSANSRSTAVAGAVAGIVRDKGHVEMQAIGASAVNQALQPGHVSVWLKDSHHRENAPGRRTEQAAPGGSRQP